MLNFRPLQVAKRKIQTYATVPTQDHDVENAYNEKRYESDNDSDYPSSVSSPYSSRASSGAYNPMLKTTSPAKPTVSAYSYRNPRAFTRYFGLAIGATLVFFILFLTHNSWSSARSVQLGLEKPPPPPPVWENFPFLKRYYGGLRTLTPRDKNKPEYPLQEDVDHDGAASLAEEAGEETRKLERRKEKEQKEKEEKKLKEHKNIPPSEAFNPYPQCNGKDCYEECFLDANDTIRIPPLQVYNGVPAGMPENIYGSYEVLGLRNDVCFDRFGRLGPYGFGYSRKYGGLGAGMEGEREGSDNVWKEVPQVDFRSIKWGDAQHRCVEKNKARFKPKPTGRNHFFQTMSMEGPKDELIESASDETPKIMIGDKKIEKATNMTETRPAKATQKQGDTKNLLPRNCVLIRTWWDYNYDEEDLVYLRALIAELGIQSGGEYTVHFLIHVKDDNKQIWADDDVYQEVLKKSLPEEFEGMGTLWSERQMGLIYGGVEESMYRNLPVHGAYRSTFMPVTYFAHLHPEFDYYWHWEMDVRYTGHYYHLFSQVSKWAAQQPRKLLWERNARFYIPQAHGTWEDFTHMVRVQTEHGTNNKANTWSSHLPPNPHVAETEPQKPEKPIWGPEVPLDYPDIEIDETLKPPSTYAEDKYTWGVNEEADLITFNPLFDPDHTNWILAEDVTGYNKTRGLPPRRTAINTSGRLSRRLLETMHREQSLHRHTMFSEMWPASCALHHGLKAVYAPHPVFIDRKWPVQYLAAIFNNGRNGASGGARLSVFSDERQNNFRGSSWYYDAGFPGNLWKRWLGFKVDGGGGEEEEMSEEGEGRMCLPGVLLHPVKQVDLIIEKKEGEK